MSPLKFLRLLIPSFCFFITVCVLFVSESFAAFSGKPETCGGCHESQFKAWQRSHHAKAMQVASDKTVLGDFDNTTASFGSIKVQFKQDKKTFTALMTEDGVTKAYVVDHTFGVFPLQQYLVSTDKGKWQVLPFAWDTRPKKEGGQAWIYLYDEEIAPQDRLHWLQPLQNWNGMCADCHSDGLQRGYEVQQDAFDTKWNNITVSCMSCHDGLHKKHSEKYKSSANAKAPSSKESKVEGWQLSTKDHPPKWLGGPRDNRFMETCFACHALRTPLTDGFASTDRFLDVYSPVSLPENLYHADGQIQEEVYVYGSFLQSKMHAAGVNCLDCHDAHSYEVKLEGNAVCTQCHAATEFDQIKHTGHAAGQLGSQCVDCHMPATTYMQVDDRRDHSFKIPRPEWHEAFQVPNACQSCHADKSTAWTLAALKKQHPNRKPAIEAETAFVSIMAGAPASVPDRLKLAEENTLSVIQRATLIESLPHVADFLTLEQLMHFAKHPQPLLRLAAARASSHLIELDRVPLLVPLLQDEYRAVRIAAYEHLIGFHLSDENKKFMLQVAQEYSQAQTQSAWRGEGRVNRALWFGREGDLAKAIDEYRMSIKIDPYFEAAYINLADLYRETNSDNQAEAVLQQGLVALPRSANVRYSLGLFYVRAQSLPKALHHLEKAYRLDKTNERFAYTYVLALQKAQGVQTAFCALTRIAQLHPEFQSLTALYRQWRHSGGVKVSLCQQ